MRSQFLLVPAAICMAATPASAVIYLSGPEAQQALFPKAQFTEDFRTLDTRQFRLIKEIALAPVGDLTFRLWKVSTGGWFVIDQVEGLDTNVTYAVGLDEKGVVTGIEILDALPDFSKIRLPAWRDQFKGKKNGDLYKREEIENISGTTLSSQHITQGVRKILTTFNMLVQEPTP